MPYDHDTHRLRPLLDRHTGSRRSIAIARAKGKQPKLSERQHKALRRMYDTGDYAISDVAELFSISRPTVYRTLGRQASAGTATAT